jgi:hypothetical protein
MRYCETGLFHHVHIKMCSLILMPDEVTGGSLPGKTAFPKHEPPSSLIVTMPNPI